MSCDVNYKAYCNRRYISLMRIIPSQLLTVSLLIKLLFLLEYHLLEQNDWAFNWLACLSSRQSYLQMALFVHSVPLRYVQFRLLIGFNIFIDNSLQRVLCLIRLIKHLSHRSRFAIMCTFNLTLPMARTIFVGQLLANSQVLRHYNSFSKRRPENAKSLDGQKCAPLWEPRGDVLMLDLWLFKFMYISRVLFAEPLHRLRHCELSLSRIVTLVLTVCSGSVAAKLQGHCHFRERAMTYNDTSNFVPPPLLFFYSTLLTLWLFGQTLFSQLHYILFFHC